MQLPKFSQLQSRISRNQNTRMEVSDGKIKDRRNETNETEQL